MRREALMKRAVGIAVALCMALVWAGPASAHRSAHHKIFPPSARPFGKTYPQWLGAYQKWLLEIPTQQNPIVDPTSPRNCESQGKVVFVGSGGSGPNCEIPEGKGIVIGDGFWECSTAEGNGQTFAALRRCATESFGTNFDPSVFRSTIHIDGKLLKHPRRWDFVSPGEIIVLPDENLTGAPGGPTKSVSEEFIYILRPLEEGVHRIRAHVVSESFGGEFTFVWKLNVVEDDDED
jgi:hypothetical protein